MTFYWPFSRFYFFYFGALGVFVPYFSLYLQSQGFSGAQIGEITATLIFARIFSPFLFGWIGDHFHWHLGVVKWTSFATVVSLLPLLWDLTYLQLLMVVAVYSFVWNASLPQYEAIALHTLRDQPKGYTRVRLWGSVGFIASVVGFGAFLDFYPVSWLPWMLIAVTAGVFLSAWSTPATEPLIQAGDNESLWPILKQPFVWGLMAVFLLMQLSHAIYYTYFSMHLSGLGYSGTEIGLFWALGVLAEIGLFIVMHHLLRRFSLYFLMMLGLVLAAARWLMIGEWADVWLVLILAQLAHAITFGVHHTVAMHYLRQYFPGRTQGRGQALYSGWAYGVGGVCGSLVGGYLWQDNNSHYVFWAATIATAVAILIMLVLRGRDSSAPATPR